MISFKNGIWGVHKIGKIKQTFNLKKIFLKITTFLLTGQADIIKLQMLAD